MKRACFMTLLMLALFLQAPIATAGFASTAVRDTAAFVFNRFGKGAAGQTVEQVTEATAKLSARNGDAVLPLLRKTGHAGYTALQDAGERAPDVIKLYARKGDEAIWIISEPRKLSIFLKHGDNAADALLKHPGIADNLLTLYGDGAAGALNSVSRQGAQRLAIVDGDGLLTATARSSELLPVIRQYGDEAMEFIWKNKGSLAVASVLTTFLLDPKAYIDGAKVLLVDPVVAPIVKSVNWTLIVTAILAVLFLPLIVRAFKKARAEIRAK